MLSNSLLCVLYKHLIFRRKYGVGESSSSFTREFKDREKEKGVNRIRNHSTDKQQENPKPIRRISWKDQKSGDLKEKQEHRTSVIEVSMEEKNNMKEINSQEEQNSNTEQGIKRNKEDKGKKQTKKKLETYSSSGSDSQDKSKSGVIN